MRVSKNFVGKFVFFDYFLWLYKQKFEKPWNLFFYACRISIDVAPLHWMIKHKKMGKTIEYFDQILKTYKVTRKQQERKKNTHWKCK